MCSGVADQIRLGFDNTPGEAPLRNVVNEDFADEKFCEIDGIDG